MTQAYDMKKLHMGCGESLQSQRTQAIYDKLRRLAQIQASLPRVEEAVLVGKKITRGGNR